MLDVLVVGAGPSGSRIAWNFAEEGYKTILIDRAEVIGEPCQCAGLITPRTFEYLGYERPIIEEMNGARLWGPKQSFLDFQASETKALVIDRPDLDRSIANKASEAGAEVLHGHTYLGHEKISGGIKARIRNKSKKFNIEARLLVGADGPLSRVAKNSGISGKREILTAFGADVKGYKGRENHVDLFVGSELAPRFFGWGIPTGPNEGRIGIATTLPHKPMPFFRDYFLKGAPSKLLGGAKIINLISGLIPFGIANPSYTDNVILTGDAAGMPKPTSGGGIYSGLISADAAFEVAHRALNSGDLSSNNLSEYQNLISERIGGELIKGSYLRKAFLTLNDDELAEIISILGEPKVKEVIEKTGDLDYASLAALSVLKTQPKLIKFAPHLLKPFI
ncbi:MAG: NAD(P)/FAD-dependent oxidoreductase [Candidatus Poseidoniia archaeon]|nr:NAD(P)/FAD-dependent oxidoreductase [Candidatus Poseidoniia archaeon]